MNKITVLRCIISIILAQASISLFAQNPIIRSFADPHFRVWNGRVYMSAGRDEYPTQPRCNIVEWGIFSSDDLVTWRHESTLYPQNTFMGEKGAKNTWASDIESRNGKYYLYFSNGNHETGVAVADKPGGPYVDALGEPLVPASYSSNREYDPTVFTDDDGTPYLIFGMDGNMRGVGMLRYQIARLNDDMISLAEKSRDIMHERPEGFNRSDRASDGSHIHKYRGVYYLSCHGDKYMTSDNLFGPYKNLRYVKLGGHSSYGEFHGQTYAAYEQGSPPYGNRRYRQCNMVYLHYRDNGDMVADAKFMQDGGPDGRPGEYYSTGVGNYDAAWPKIEAEWFFSKTPEIEKRDGPSNEFMLQGIQNKSTVCFPLVQWTKANTSINFSVKALEAATIEIREKDENGELLGSIQIEPNADWQTVTTKLNNEAGTQNLCFRFLSSSSEKEILQLDWFSLK